MQISWNFWPLSLLPKRDLIKYVSQMVILAPYSSFSVSISYVWGKSHFAIDRQEEKLTLFTRTFETYETEAIKCNHLRFIHPSRFTQWIVNSKWLAQTYLFHFVFQHICLPISVWLSGQLLLKFSHIAFPYYYSAQTFMEHSIFKMFHEEMVFVSSRINAISNWLFHCAKQKLSKIMWTSFILNLQNKWKRHSILRIRQNIRFVNRSPNSN